MAWSDPSSRSTNDTVTAAIWNQDVVSNPQFLHDNFPESTFVPFSNFRLAVGTGTFYKQGDGSLAMHTRNYRGAADAADGDSYEASVVLAAGTYEFMVHGLTQNDKGLLDWELEDADGNTISITTGQDWYSASLTYNVLKTASGIVVPAPGRYILRATVNGKNGSSTDYTINLSYALLYIATATAAA